MSKGTPHRTVRIDDELWAASIAKATERGEKVSDAIRRALVLYVEDQHVKGTDRISQRGALHIENCPDCNERFGANPATRPM